MAINRARSRITSATWNTGRREAKQNHFLIIGPWDHAGTRTPRREVGGLKFGEASVLDLNKLHTEWYDWVMKSGKKPEFLKKRVAYYVVGAGAENWKYADGLESISNEKRTLYLDSNGKADGVFQSGMLADKPGTGVGQMDLRSARYAAGRRGTGR